MDDPSAADTRWTTRVLQSYRRMPLRLRMIGTALLGTLIGLVTYEIVYALNPLEPRAPTSWLVAYAVGITRQYSLHRWLTFEHGPPYWPGLARAYVMYAGSALVGTGLDWLLTGAFGLNHRLVWFICLCTTAGISLVFLRRYVFRHTGM